MGYSLNRSLSNVSISSLSDVSEVSSEESSFPGDLFIFVGSDGKAGIADAAGTADAIAFVGSDALNGDINNEIRFGKPCENTLVKLLSIVWKNVTIPDVIANPLFNESVVIACDCVAAFC